MHQIALATTDSQIQQCFPVMLELRPHLTADTFVSQVRRQQDQSGYQLLFRAEDGRVQALAGFRLSECLAWGRFIYVDDLITAAGDRSKGYGNQLLAWLMDYARTHNCQSLQLDSGVQRFDAHRFYMREGMHISSHHFSLNLS